MSIYKYTDDEKDFLKVEDLPLLNKRTKQDVEYLKNLIEQGRQAEKDLESLKNSCKHEYFYDEEGYPYHYRYCSTCGKLMYCI